MNINIQQELYEYPTIHNKILDIHKEIEEIEQLVYYPSSSTGGIRGSNISDPTANKAINKIDPDTKEYLEYLREQKKHYIKIRKGLDRALKTLRVEDKNLIDSRYFKKNKWEIVARQTLICVTNCHRNHKRIIKQLKDELLKEDIKGY